MRKAVPQLAWTEDRLVPHAVLHGKFLTLERVVAALDEDRQAWISSLVLAPDDVAMTFKAACEWGAAVASASPAELRLWRSLIAVDPLLASQRGLMPFTPLRFTSGQQRFLRAARQLAEVTTREHLESALTDGTVRDDRLPSLRWDERDNRDSALTVIRGPVARPVGKEWLAFRGLTTLPVVGAAYRYPRQAWRWPLQQRPLALDELRELLVLPQADGRYGTVRIEVMPGTPYSAFRGAQIRGEAVGRIGVMVWTELGVVATDGGDALVPIREDAPWKAQMAPSQP